MPRYRNFYPRSPCGERQSITNERAYLLAISIHALLAESDGLGPGVGGAQQRISIHALLAESDLIVPAPTIVIPISIHALLAESDNLRVLDGSKSSIISIHALLAESDAAVCKAVSPELYFYPRSPCGERQYPVQD